MENIKQRLINLGYDETQADNIIKFYENKNKIYSLLEYLKCMEMCNCQGTDIEECMTTCY